jgi:5'-methylthioadenosine phosphorylase
LTSFGSAVSIESMHAVGRTAEQRLTVGVIGGGVLPEQWGLPYDRIEIETDYGSPSAPVAATALAERTTVYSILRHGERHAVGSAVNYRANVAALHELGCDVVLSLSLAGTLTERFDVGDIVIYDDVLDFRRSSQSFFGPEGIHCSMAPLVASPLEEQLRHLARELDKPYGATMVVIEGPRYSTRAESRMFVRLGGELVCQTAAPECFLVREKQMDWCGMCLVTDRDTLDDDALVSTDLIFGNLERHKAAYAATVLGVIQGLEAYARTEDVERATVPHELLDRYRP